MVERFLSDPIDLPPTAERNFARVDLVFYGVDHSGPSYEGRVYLDTPDADLTTGREHPRYAGSFHVFGHGGCFGELGHCDVPTGPPDPFDQRPPHQLTPAVKTVIITDALRAVLTTTNDATSTRVSVVAVTPGEATNEVLAFDSVRLVTYA